MRYRIVLNLKIWAGLRRLAVYALWIGGGGGLVVGVFVASFYLAMRADMRSTQVEVPPLEGLTLADAEHEVEPLGLVLQVVEERNDPRVASGRVLAQVPPTGSAVRRGRKVKLVLSLGGQVLEVPDMVGHAARTVAIELRREGLIPGEEAHVYSYEIPAGRVMAQVPPASADVVPNSRIHRLVSDGPRTPSWVMPDLHGLSRGRAEEWITSSGFRAGNVRRVRARGTLRGTVVAQTPLAGYPIRSRDIVELTIAE